jgi:molybdopterin/thiamine biosynthesis adenylyltransferase|tara:strand:+ start:2261 stop:3010 length:750 start_codon:yes stop_codon:yes gene_type:complete
MKITNEQIKRYSGQINLKKININGQAKIINSKILIIGLGGLGTPALTYLARSGVGTIGIADSDIISLSNLHRQILYEKNNLGKYKVDIAKKKILSLNSKIKIKTFKKKITKKNIGSIAKNYEIILDGTDSFKSKLEINDYCKKNNKILILGAISKFIGQLFVFNFKDKKQNSPCLRCFMPEAPSNDDSDCQAHGIIGTIAGVIGTLMSNEAIKEILSFKESLCGKILIVDLEKTIFRLINLKKNCKNHK